MGADTNFQSKVQRIGELVAQFEASADPNSRAMATELVESLMALHGAGIERMLEIAANSGEAGKSVIEDCGSDELVSSLLLLYGLHPLDLHARVVRSLDKLQPFLQSHSAKAELISVTDEGAVAVRLEAKAGGCGSSASLVKSTLDAAIQDAAPDATSIVIEEAGELLTRSGFVPIARLENVSAVGILAAGRAQGSAD